MSPLPPLPEKDSPAYRALTMRKPISAAVANAARQIIDDVRQGGDEAVRELSERFDRVALQRSVVEEDKWKQAVAGLDPAVRRALEEMARRIEAMHRAQQFHERVVEVVPGVRVWREWRPFTRVGIYAPGGRTVYPSSVLMLGVPARLAGCAEIVLCSPPQRDGTIAPSMLAAAAIGGVTEIHAVGGAQAIAALAYGTESIRRVDMIAGPGNAYVTAAKLAVYGDVAIDMPAGPSELVVISDGTADAYWLRSDLQAQAEHSPDALSILVSTSPADAKALDGVDPARVSGYLVPSLKQAVVFANDFAPEHLMLACRQPHALLPSIHNAGSVFLGPASPAAAGDYATGANHVLPTGGTARSFGPLSVLSFGRAIQVQEIDGKSIEQVVAVTDVMAAAEALPSHGASVRHRARRAID